MDEAPEGGFMPYVRNENGWPAAGHSPARQGLEHRVGGLEKDCVKGCISHDPSNHQKMVRTRAEKVAKAVDDIPAQSRDGAPRKATCWWSAGEARADTCKTAVDQTAAPKASAFRCAISTTSIPLPHGVREIFSTIPARSSSAS